MKFLAGLALGAYAVGAVVTFAIMGLMCLLGGNPADLWRPFVYAAVWPLFWAWLVLDIAGLI